MGVTTRKMAEQGAPGSFSPAKQLLRQQQLSEITFLELWSLAGKHEAFKVEPDEEAGEFW